MGSVPAPLVRECLLFLDYEMLPGSNNPSSEHWQGADGTLVFFPYARSGDQSAFLERPVREFLEGLSPFSLRKLKAMLDSR